MSNTTTLSPEDHHPDPNSPQEQAKRDGLERTPAVVDDNPSPAGDVAAQAAAAPPVERKEEPEGPKDRIDPRASLAKQISGRRPKREGAPLNLDMDSLPGDAVLEAAKEDPDEEIRKLTGEALQKPDAPKQSAEPAKQDGYAIQVNGRALNVSRQELLDAAGLTEETARGVPQTSLIALAQKQVAADLILMEAKTRARESRASNDGVEHHDASEQRRSAAENQGDEDDSALIERLQLADKDEALAALDKLVDKRLNTKLAQAGQQNVQRGLAGQWSAAAESFKGENPDIVGNGVLANAHRSEVIRAVVTDLQAAAPELFAQNPNAAAYLVNNPEKAFQAHALAAQEGRTVSKPADLVNKAGDQLREAMGLKAPSRDTAPTGSELEASRDRVADKRRLMQQPTRFEQGQQTPQRQPMRSKTVADIVREKRKANHLPVL